MPEGIGRGLMEPRGMDDPVGIGLDRACGELARGELIDELLPSLRWMFHPPGAGAPGRTCRPLRRSPPCSGFVQPVRGPNAAESRRVCFYAQ